MRRFSFVEQQILFVLRQGQSRISYDDLAALIDCDRRTVITAIRRLELRHLIVVAERGHGSKPNRYALAERVYTGKPSAPWPVVKIAPGATG
jgi:DNA-binding transcriptional MocR family regulator